MFPLTIALKNICFLNTKNFFLIIQPQASWECQYNARGNGDDSKKKRLRIVEIEESIKMNRRQGI